MTQARVFAVPFHGPVRSRRLDLALALAVLSQAVKVHERVERASGALGNSDSRSHALGRYEHAKPMGA